MPNKNYQKGVRKERAIVNEARKEGLIASRTAGSHGVYDVYILDLKNSHLKLIQIKTHKIEKPKPLKLPLIVKELHPVTLSLEHHHYYTR